jgi:hypothetical protein
MDHCSLCEPGVLQIAAEEAETLAIRLDEVHALRAAAQRLYPNRTAACVKIHESGANDAIAEDRKERLLDAIGRWANRMVFWLEQPTPLVTSGDDTHGLTL